MSLNSKSKSKEIFSTLFSDYYVLGSKNYFQYYQNVSNDDIIKLYEKFQPDFLAFGYTLDGLINKV